MHKLWVHFINYFNLNALFICIHPLVMHSAHFPIICQPSFPIHVLNFILSTSHWFKTVSPPSVKGGFNCRSHKHCYMN